MQLIASHLYLGNDKQQYFESRDGGQIDTPRRALPSAQEYFFDSKRLVDRVDIPLLALP